MTPRPRSRARAVRRARCVGAPAGRRRQRDGGGGGEEGGGGGGSSDDDNGHMRTLPGSVARRGNPARAWPRRSPQRRCANGDIVVCGSGSPASRAAHVRIALKFSITGILILCLKFESMRTSGVTRSQPLEPTPMRQFPPSRSARLLRRAHPARLLTLHLSKCRHGPGEVCRGELVYCVQK